MAASNCKVCSYFQFIIERRIQKSSPIGHDFFEEQPIKDATVFLTRYTAHNWSDKYATKYLSRLRDAARPDTKLVLMDNIQDYLCRSGDSSEDIPGAAKARAPEPLLPYPDTATGWAYGMDLYVCRCYGVQKSSSILTTTHR